MEAVGADPQTKAAIKVRGLADDMGGAGALQQKLDDLGPDAMKVDVLGERGRSVARSAANIEPSARETLESALFGRKATQNQRVVSDIEQASGLAAGSRETVDTLKRKAYEEIAPEINRAYTQAREAGYDLPLSAIDDILTTPMGKQARLDALKAVQNRYYKEVPRGPALAPGAPPAPKDKSSSSANRMVRELGPKLGPRPRKPSDLLDFVKDKGGLRDFKGELRSLDAKTVRGLVRENGISLDQARELAAREGFLDYKFGNADRAVAESTVGDFLDAIDNNLRGNPVFSTSDGWAADAWLGYKDGQASRASIYETAKRIAEESGGKPINDDVFRDAIEGVLQKGEGPAEALQRAQYADFAKFGSQPQEVPAGIFEKNLRNYSNLSLLDEMKRSLDDVAGAANRGGRPNEASQASGMAKDLRTRVDSLLNDDVYATARGLRQKAYKADEAFDLGADLGRGRVAMDLPGKARKVDPEFKPNVAKAYATTKAETLLNRGATEGALNELSTPLGREAMDAALGPNASSVVKALEREKTFNRTTRAVAGNSTTARQLAEMGASAGGGAATAAALGYDASTGGLAGILAALTKKGVPAMSKKLSTDAQRKAAPLIAQMLVERGVPPQVAAKAPGVLERLTKAGGNEKLMKALLMLVSPQAQKANPLAGTTTAR
jgi:hypothetical protein